MKAPLSWLKDYVDIDVTAEELEAKLFSCGFEVEDVVWVGKNIDKIVVAKILSIDLHPNADKLSVTKIDAGSYGILQIVTSAKNISVGDLVPVALDGSTLANGERIFNGVLRGAESNGMFCSGEELGITDDFYPGASVNGILILKEEYPLGAEVKEVLGISDVIFDINVTANRPDCQSILGIAREIAAVLQRPLKMPNTDYSTHSEIKTTKTLEVKNEARDLCPRYLSHYVKDIQLAESPLWMKRRLASVGIRSINNIVDITNFVLIEMGQPMHAFDLETIGGRRIVVRRAKNGEKITTLDEKNFTLDEKNLVICDAEKPIAIAGIMGGLNSEIKETTKNVVFESAKFARDSIRRTSRTLGQSSDSSSRFEKGVDAYTCEIAMNRALHLIEELDCGAIACDRYDLGDTLTKKTIRTEISKINGVLGIEVPTEEIKGILERLQFDVRIDGDKIDVDVPLYREDIDNYPDLAEEVIREYGYDHIDSTLMKTAEITKGGKSPLQRCEDDFKNTLCAMGFNEIITYSFVSEKEYDDFAYDKTLSEHRFVKIVNPLGEDLGIMRTVLIPSIVRVAAKNINRKNLNGRLFELANVYLARDEGELPKETKKLSLCVYGDGENFFTLKGVIEEVLAIYCAAEKVEYRPTNVGTLHLTRSAEILVDGVSIGHFGELHPSVADKLGIDKRILVGELNYEEFTRFFRKKMLCKSIPKYPSVERDLAVIVNESVSCGEIIDCIRANGPECLEKIAFFDLYQGSQVAKGKKSLAFNLIFQSSERTLNVEEVDDYIKTILAALSRAFAAELR